MRGRAAWALGELKDNCAAETLILLLTDNDRNVRSNAREALIKIGSPAAAALLAALQSDNVEQKREAILVLAGIQEARAVEPLLALLRNNDRQPGDAAVSVLGKIGTPSVGPLLEVLLNENGNLRHLAVLALEGTRDAGAVESLARVLRSEKNYQIRSSVIRALGTIGGGRAAAVLGDYFISTPGAKE